MTKKKNILIATAFPTHGAGSGALVTTQAKSYVEDGHNVVIITGNNRTDFDKLEGVKYHIVPFTAENENPEKIEGQVPFNYLMFTTHTESTANFWNVDLQVIEMYCENFKKALKEEVKNFNPDVIHAQHNWLLSSEATRMGKPVVTTIHGTDLMGYEKAKIKLNEVEEKIDEIIKQNSNKQAEYLKVKEIFARPGKYSQIINDLKKLMDNNSIDLDKSKIKEIANLYSEEKKYRFYIDEAENSAKKSDKIIVISDAQKEKFVNLFPYAENKVELLENGYDPKVFYKDNNVNKEEIIGSLKSNITDDGKISTDYTDLILFVGKFADFKGIDSMLVANKIYDEKLKELGKKPLTIIVGSGVLEDKLKEEAKRLGLENTHFVGRQPHSVIRPLQNISTVSLIPSRNEPFGLVVIEGTACGHPVIGSNSGGIPGILNTEKGELPNQDVIKTELGALIRPLPERPSTLSDEEKDKLDIYAEKYTLSDEENMENIIKEASKDLSIEKNDAKEYLEDYKKSTEALADATVKIATKEFEYDNDKIAEYTKDNYSQSIIRDKLIKIFDDAEEHSREKDN